MNDRLKNFIKKAKEDGIDDKTLEEVLGRIDITSSQDRNTDVRTPNTLTSVTDIIDNNKQQSLTKGNVKRKNIGMVKENKNINNRVEVANKSMTKYTDQESEDYLLEEAYNLQDELEIWYLISPLVQAGLPHRKPKSNEFTRINGRLELCMMAPQKIGLPSGVPPRLLLIYICTTAKKRSSQTVSLGRNMRDLLHMLNVPVTSGKNGSVKAYTEQLKKLLATHFTIIENFENTSQQRQGINIKHAQIINNATLWWDTSYKDSYASLELSDQFYQTVSDSAVPLDARAISILKSSPMELDIYCWLTYRLRYLKKPTLAPWKALMQQLGAHYKEQKTFKYNFLMALKSVLKVYDHANIYEHPNGLVLKPSRSHVKSISEPDKN